MPKKRGRPRKTFNLKEVEMLGYFHATYDTMASFLDCSVDTIRKNMNDIDSEFYKAYKKGINSMKMKLSEAQLNSALKDKNVTMQIWLGKNYLGQSDNPLGEEEDNVSILFEGWDD